jgi:hypothetical protein
MGAQAYQAAIETRASTALARIEPGWRVEQSIARSRRSKLPGTTRLPMGWLTNASPRARRTVGAAVYPKEAVVHRMDLLLPPPPGAHVITLHDVVAWRFSDESPPVGAAAERLAMPMQWCAYRSSQRKRLSTSSASKLRM